MNNIALDIERTMIAAVPKKALTIDTEMLSRLQTDLRQRTHGRMEFLIDLHDSLDVLKRAPIKTSQFVKWICYY